MAVKWVCEKCGWKMPLDYIKHQERVEGDLEIGLVCCTHCGREYVYSVTDSQLRQDIENLKKRNERVRAMVLAKKLDAAGEKRERKRIDKARKNLDQAMRKKREEYINGR